MFCPPSDPSSLFAMSNPISVFNAGPAKLPNEILAQISSELLNFENTGMSVLEISHRSPEFSALVKETGCLLREIMDIPDNYKVLWLQGGASGMFSAIPLNLISGKEDVVDYLVTGTWSKGAAKEAEKYANVNYVVPVPSDFTGSYFVLWSSRLFPHSLHFPALLLPHTPRTPRSVAGVSVAAG